MDNISKTALVLGGGGARGAYEIGVWQALREMDIKIHIVSGCSVGAINGAMVAQDSYQLAVDLWKAISTDMVLDTSIPKKNPSPLKLLLNQYIDERKIRKNSVEFGLVALELPSLATRTFFLEDIPQGKLNDYIVASSSLFPAFNPTNIENTKYVDGGYFDNLPVSAALTKGATHIIAVDLETAGIVQKEPLSRAENLTLISCKWDLGNIMTFDGKSSMRNLRLGYLDALKAFGFFDGYYYTFSKGGMNRRTLKSAETAARIFQLNPETLFTKESLQKEMKSKVSSYRNEAKFELQRFQGQIKSRKPSIDALSDLLKKINQKSITIIIADYLKANPGATDSLLAKPISLLFKDESAAANYLIKEKII